ncbi:MAG TPA: MBL fold metallo-hydrolase, partial [Hydrogenispora sp.]|nr:MBL fold metallo-hydrolase [Hydrogenispora sp.]
THVLFVGYQAEGTLGRRLLDGAKAVKIFGEEILVKAQILKIEGFSAHADQEEMLRWLRGFVQKPTAVFLVHGDADVLPVWEQKIRETLNLTTIIPELGQRFDLAETATEERSIITVPNSQEQLRQLLLMLDEKYLDFRGRLRQQANQIGPDGLVALAQELEKLNKLIEEKSLSS